MNLLRALLFPFALLYGAIMYVRNKLFDWHIYSSKSYPISVISIGNISMGGTGKTPHIEYLVRLLQPNYTVATLSRGYGRSTKGFLLADNNKTYKQVGDEPVQYQSKFENLIVAVDEKRTRGIETLLHKFHNIEVILLDDAFQHRFVKPGLSILLTDYHKLYTNDFVFPTGTLREFKYAAQRADIIVVTKTPAVFSPILKQLLLDEIQPKEHQQVYLSYIKYGPITSSQGTKSKTKKFNTIIALTGIANAYPLQEHLKGLCEDLIPISFPDHYEYQPKDIELIKEKLGSVLNKSKIIVTTEKDITRLKNPFLEELIKDIPLYYVPIEVQFHGDGKVNFNKQITDYVHRHSKKTITQLNLL